MNLRRRKEDTEVTAKEADVKPWTVRYTALLDNGVTVSWDRTYNFESSAGKEIAAGQFIAAGLGRRDPLWVSANGIFYPPHRIREITWKVN